LLLSAHPAIFRIFSGVYERKGEKSTGISRIKCGMEDKETDSNISLTRIRAF
jgi:hypothetical protein